MQLGGSGAARPAALPPSVLTDPTTAQGPHFDGQRAGSAAWFRAPGAETGRREMAQPGDAEASNTKPRRKVLGHSLACARCAKSKIKCDGARPCSRCMQRGMANECEDQEGVLSHTQTPPAAAGAKSSQAPGASNIIDDDVGSKPRPKPLKHAQACVHCSRSKVRCDGGRPCGRCVRRGLSDACRSRQAASDDGVALVRAVGEGDATPRSEGLEGCLKLRASGLGISRLSSAGAAIPQQSASVGLLPQGSATVARDDSAAAMDGGVLPATPRMDSLLKPVLQPMQSPFGTTQAPLARTPGSERSLGLFSPGNSSNLGLYSLGNSSSSLGSVSDLFLNSPKVRCSAWGAHVPAGAPPTPSIPNLYSLGSSSSLASFSGDFSVADSAPNLGLCSLGSSSRSLEGSGMGGVGAKPVQGGGALPVLIHERSFDMGSHSEPSQLWPSATLVNKNSLLGGASLDQCRGAEQGSHRCIATSDLYSDRGKDDADATGSAALGSDSGPLIVEVDVTFPVKRRCRLSLVSSCRDAVIRLAGVSAG